MEEQIVASMERPTKKVKLDADDSNHWIQQLTQLNPSDSTKFLEFLQRIHVQLHENKFHEDSWLLRSLCRILTIRMGCWISSNKDPEIARCVSLSFRCLQHCYEHITIHHSETSIIFRTVVQLLDEFVGQTEDICQNAIALFQMWFTNNSQCSKWLLKDRSALEEMTMVLVQIVTKKQVSMAWCIRDFFRQQQQQQQQGGQSKNTIQCICDIALRVLDDDQKDNSIPIYETEDDHLFFIECLAVVEKRKPTREQIQLLISLLKSSLVSQHKAIKVLTHCIQYLTNTQQVIECTHVITEWVLESDSSNDCVPAMKCLEKLLIQQRPSHLSITQLDELLECCSKGALDGSTCNPSLRDSATSVLLILIDMGIQNTSTTTTQKHRLLDTLAQILHSCHSKDLSSRAVLLACQWITAATKVDVDGDDILLQHHGEALVHSLAHVIMANQISNTDTSLILKTIATILQHSKQQNIDFARIPKFLDAIVTLLRCPTEDHAMAMNVLLTLSENPCNRRVLAKHPGMLSSMIHFVRRPPTRGLSSRNTKEGGDIKRQILLFAQAL